MAAAAEADRAPSRPTAWTFDTELTADAVEVCPVEGHRAHGSLAVATYQLDVASGRKRGRLWLLDRVDRVCTSDAEGQAVGGGESVACASRAHVWASLDTEAILDAQWSPTPFAGQPMLALAENHGRVELVAVETGREEDGATSTLALRPHAVWAPEGAEESSIALTLAWTHTRARAADPSLITSSTDGTVAWVVVGEAGCMETRARWNAHTYEWGGAAEVWAAAPDPHTVGERVFSGGDDSRLCGWDLRDTRRPTFVSREHEAGVCSIAWHPHTEHVVATGSYDERVLVWDARSMKKPMAVRDGLGGGVWRLRWHPSASRPEWLLGACMRGGVRLLRVPRSGSVDEIDWYSNHPSEALAYGVAWGVSAVVSRDEDAGAESVSHDLESPWILSCSFYDHSLHAWRARVRDADP